MCCAEDSSEKRGADTFFAGTFRPRVHALNVAGLDVEAEASVRLASQLLRPAKYELTGYGLFDFSDSAALATLCIARVLYPRMLFFIIIVDV